MNIIKRCRVCGDKATGFNYQGLSCESCKVFFHRNNSKIEKFKCRKSGNCQIDIQRRKLCTKCRLEKCFQIGMCKPAVNNGQSNRQGQPEPTDKKWNLVDNVLNIVAIREHLLELHPEQETKIEQPYEDNHLIETIRRNSNLNAYEQERINEICNNLTCIFEDETTIKHVYYARNIVEAFRQPEPFIRKVIKFCKSIDGYRLLNSNDQFIILKQYCPEIFMIHFSFIYDVEKDGFVFYEDGDHENSIGRFISYNLGRNWKNEELIQINRNFTIELKHEFENDKTIRDLLKAQMLFRSRDMLSRPEFIRYHYIRYAQLLIRYLEHKYQNMRRARKKYSQLMRLMYRTNEIANNNRILMSELDINLIPHIFAEIYNLN